MTTLNPYKLPTNLPAPTNDGACNHLVGMKFPPLRLKSTANESVDLDKVAKDRAIFFFFSQPEPRTTKANKEWDQIPGARGCTLEVLGFKARLKDFLRHKTPIYGVAALPLEELLEFADREHILFELISDPQRKFSDLLQIPTFNYKDTRYFKKLAFYCEGGIIRQVIYPAFPPDQLAERALADFLD